MPPISPTTHMMNRTWHSFMLGLLAILPITVALAGCEGQFINRPSAIGREGEVVVVIDSTQWKGPIGEALREQVGPWLGTLPVPEKLFDLRQVSLTSERMYEQVKMQKNVLFVAPLSDSTNEARFLQSRLDEQAQQVIRSGQPAIISRTDLWRRHQQVYYITAANPEALVQAIKGAGEELRYRFTEITRARVELEMFEKERQFDIEAQIMDKHGFAVNVQHDYFTAIDTTNFVWLRRVVSSESWRSLFIYYVDNANPADLTPEWIYETQDALTRKYIRGNLNGYVKIDYRRPLETENINFLDRYGYETRGLWYMVMDMPDGKVMQAGGGGPFLTYAFYDQGTARIYMISGQIFAPGYDKREFLRHLEVIAHTFRTQQEEQAAAAQDLAVHTTP